MRYLRVRITDPELEAAIDGLPRGTAGEVTRRALAAHLLPGGHGEILARLSAVEEAVFRLSERMAAMASSGAIRQPGAEELGESDGSRAAAEAFLAKFM